MRTSINSRGPGFVTAAPPPCALHAARSGQTQAAPEVRAGRARAQAADVGVGIMGKEGRQAVNNSDYAVSQFRFLTRLLLLHGSLSAYRLSRLIKYSFYKNIAFGGMLFFFQFYCGFSGQARSRPPKRGVAWLSKGAQYESAPGSFAGMPFAAAVRPARLSRLRMCRSAASRVASRARAGRRGLG